MLDTLATQFYVKSNHTCTGRWTHPPVCLVWDKIVVIRFFFVRLTMRLVASVLASERRQNREAIIISFLQQDTPSTHAILDHCHICHHYCIVTIAESDIIITTLCGHHMWWHFCQNDQNFCHCQMIITKKTSYRRLSCPCLLRRHMWTGLCWGELAHHCWIAR